MSAVVTVAKGPSSLNLLQSFLRLLYTTPSVPDQCKMEICPYASEVKNLYCSLSYLILESASVVIAPDEFLANQTLWCWEGIWRKEMSCL
jgi:hypothetical protein